MKRLIKVSALPFLALLLYSGPAAVADDQPLNVIIVMADDMNGYVFKDDFPGPTPVTPHLDAFRESSVTFRNAYCPAPSCMPSRAAFFSGMQPFRSGVYWNDSSPWDRPQFLEIEAMPQWLRNHGYTTFAVGKVYHHRLPPEMKRMHWDNDPRVIDTQGYGPFAAEEDQVVDPDSDEPEWARRFWGVTEWTGPDTDFPDVRVLNNIRNFLSRDHEQPFFLVQGLWRPHTPFTAPQRFFDLYDPEEFEIPPEGFCPDDLDNIPPMGRELAAIWGHRFGMVGPEHPERWRRFIHGFLACTSFADWTFGQTLEALRESRYADNTIVIFVSDNGYHTGEKHHWEKTTLWEIAALVPMVIHVPGHQNAGTVLTQPAGLIDVYPTLVDLLGLPSPGHELCGNSLQPIMDNPDLPWFYPAVTVENEGMYSARMGNFRFIQYSDGTEELYDHAADPTEFRNLADDPAYESVRENFRRWMPSEWVPTVGGRRG